MTSIIKNDFTEDERHSENTELREKGLAMDRWFRSAEAAESMPDSLVAMRPQFNDPQFKPRLGGLLYTFRDQPAKEPKDKIYSLNGMAEQEYEIKISYNDNESKGGITKRTLYILTT
jgi:hypothetical protein